MKLQPHDARYAKVGDTKRMLEWVLQRYTAVAAGDTLVVNYRNQDFSFNILEVSPGKAIRLIDSDVAVDFAPPLSGEAVPKMKDAGDDERATATVAVPVAVVPTSAGAPGHAVGSVDLSGVENVDWKRCPNCRRGIPIASFDRHSLPCARLNWFCELCHVAVEKRSQLEHVETLHSVMFCDCGTEMEARFLEAHKQTECVLRDRDCAFCKLRMPHAELLAHENQCGSKTERCDKCKTYVTIRELAGHENVCGIVDKAVPPLRNYLGDNDWGAGAPPRRHNADDTLFTCPHCSEPFQAMDDFEVHMLVTHPELLPQEEQPEQKPQAEQEKQEDPAPFVFQPPDL